MCKPIPILVAIEFLEQILHYYRPILLFTIDYAVIGHVFLIPCDLIEHLLTNVSNLFAFAGLDFLAKQFKEGFPSYNSFLELQ